MNANTPVVPPGVRLEAMRSVHLDAVLRLEQSAYAHPWARQNFADALQHGYHAQLLLQHDDLLGYCVAMPGPDEVHVLNIAVAPDHQRQGWGRWLLNDLAQWAQSQHAQFLWLEVRSSNQRAIHLYEQQGFGRIGLRKDYYPQHHGQREDALVMRRALCVCQNPPHAS